MSVTEIVGSQENIIATIRAVKRGFSFISRSYNKVNVCFFTFGSDKNVRPSVRNFTSVSSFLHYSRSYLSIYFHYTSDS